MSIKNIGGNVPVAFHKVKIQDNFWEPRIKTNAAQTLYSQLNKLNETHRLPAFKMDWKPGDEFEPHIFWDSDVAKWIEGASYSIIVCPDPKMEKLLDEAVDLVISAQQPDGYLNVHYTVVEPDKRWSNLRDCHELYCAGHLIEAAVAHYRATGKRKMLDCLCRYADYIDSVFGVEPGKKRGYCGHPELELALIKLYEATGNEGYLKLSSYFIEEHGQRPFYFDIEAIERGEDITPTDALPPHMRGGERYEYTQADVPIREQTKVAGHAVRAMYFYSGAADLAGINDDQELYSVLKRLLDSLINKRMYITGGIGPAASNEGFTTDYDLPNRTAYAETCAAIGLIMWSHRMLRFDLDNRYGDVMERALYNGSISGISLCGNKYFYENPLASNGNHHRVDWFGCSCCPTNILRLIASLGGYIYSQSTADAIVHLYVQSEGELQVGDKIVKLSQKTNNPWDGAVSISVGLDQPSKFSVKCRVPGWCDSFEVGINGEPLEDVVVKNGYLQIEREWRDGDCIELNFPMLVKRMYANPNINEDAGLVALQRGPVLYCLEGTDNAEQPHRIFLPEDAEFEAAFEADLLDGVTTITIDALCLDDEGWEDKLYRDTPPVLRPATIKAVPYYAWDNREPDWMSVWLKESGS